MATVIEVNKVKEVGDVFLNLYEEYNFVYNIRSWDWTLDAMDLHFLEFLGDNKTIKRIADEIEEGIREDKIKERAERKLNNYAHDLCEDNEHSLFKCLDGKLDNMDYDFMYYVGDTRTLDIIWDNEQRIIRRAGEDFDKRNPMG